jgi:excisionase family DNA binding protein
MYITTREVAERFGVSRQMIWKMVKGGKLPEPIRQRGRLGSHWILTKSLVDILDAIDSNNNARNVSEQTRRLTHEQH